MSDSILYQLYCVDEARTYTVYGNAIPTVCPTNTNHIIAAAASVPNYEGSVVQVKEEYIKTGGNYKTKGLNFELAPLEFKTYDVSFPRNVTLLNFTIFSEDENYNDCMNVYAAPGKVIGVLTAPAVTSDTLLHINDVSLLDSGFLLGLQEGGNVHDCGEILTVNSGNNTVVVANAVVGSFNAFSTFVNFTIHRIEDFIMPKKAIIQLGTSKIGGAAIPADIILRLTYENKGNVAKTFTSYFEYLY